MSVCSCGRKPAEFGARCVYVTRLAAIARRASAHAGRRTGRATCSCHMGADFDPHVECARVRRAERLSAEARANARAHYAATRWAS